MLRAPDILVNEVGQVYIWDETALIAAARYGHAATITALISVPGILVNKATPIGHTALMVAACNGHFDAVTVLLAASAGILVNQTTPQRGVTALIWAAREGHTAIVIALLATPGILVNHLCQENIRCETALMMAAIRGHTATVTALLAAPGIDLNIENENGETAIAQAFETGRHDIVTLLQAHGAVLPERLRQAGNHINGRQSVHEVSVHISVSHSAKNLREYYGFTPENFIENTTELFTWLSSDFSEDSQLPEEYNPNWLVAARACFCKLNMSDFTDQRSGLRMQEALAYVWAGINNKHAKGKDSSPLSREEVTSRRINFLKNLYEIQREYNLAEGANPLDNGGEDNATCASGSFNKLIAALNEVGHVGVEIVYVNQAVITLQVPFLTKQAFGALSEEDRKRFAQSWENENSEELQAECFALLQYLVSTRLHETYDEFNAEVPNLNVVISNAAANVQHTDMDAVMNQERETIQKKEHEAQAERERQAAAVAAPMPAVRQQRAAVVFSCDTRGVKRSRAAVANNQVPEEAAAAVTVMAVGRYPKRNTRSFTGSYTK